MFNSAHIHRIFVALLFLCVASLNYISTCHAQPILTVSLGCNGEKTFAPQGDLMRVKGDDDRWEFRIQKLNPEMTLVVKKWTIQKEGDPAPLEIQDNQATIWGSFGITEDKTVLTWPLDPNATGTFTITATIHRSCGGHGFGVGGAEVDEDLTWNGSVFGIEIKRQIAGSGQFDPITDANRNVLPRQKMILKAEVTGLPQGATPSYVWETLPGKVFEDWTANQDRATLTEIYPDDLDQQIINFYWANAGDGRKVKVSVTVNAKTVDAEATFNIKPPTSTFKVTELGATRSSAAGDTLGLYGVPALNDGIVYMGKISMPTGFTEGQLNFVQLAKSNYKKTGTDGKVYHGYDDGIWDLDTRYPTYPPPFASHPGTAGSWAADGGENYYHDDPRVPLEADAQTYDVRLDCKTYLMFLPPGEDSRYVPLRMFTWAYGAIVNKEAAGWVRQEGSDIQTSNPVKEQQAPEESEHPTWFVRFNPDLFTWNKGAVAVNIIPTTVNEGAGTVSGQANVTVLENVAAPLVVNLSASDVTAAIVPAGGEKIVVPATVTIPANSKSVQFSFTVTNNDTKDSTQIMRVTASATGYTETEDTVAVLDND